MSDQVGTFTPFFVADRQASLRILAGLKINYGRKYGIMTHANTFIPFQEAFKNYPCIDMENCQVIGGRPCIHMGKPSECPFRSAIRASVVKICDSGVFQKKGCEIDSYDVLFEKYDKMQTHYGIIMDFLKDKKRTLETAHNAMEIYRKKSHSFKLIGVAQGNTVDEYQDCYRALKAMGYDHIAVGGMLTRRDKSARYVKVRDESLLKNTLSSIREIDQEGWLFALGCYSPKRHSVFLEHSVSGADYKGWIFQYEGVSPIRGDEKSQSSRFSQVRSFINDEIIARSQVWRKGPRLLIIPCSKAKNDFKGRVQAINLYDGPLYRMLRNNVHNFSNQDGLDIMILSAKYGLIEPTKKIANYDQRMTSARAEEIQGQVDTMIKELVEKKEYSDVLVNLGSDYLPSIKPSLKRFSTAEITILNGRIGERLRGTKEWLYN